MNQLTFCTLLATVLTQLFLFCWYGNDLTYEVTYFIYLGSLVGGGMIYIYIYLLQLGCYPVAVVILHVNKT